MRGIQANLDKNTIDFLGLCLSGPRALGHGVADVATLGLWEIAGTPIEGVANGQKTQLEVHYNHENKVKKVIVLKGRALSSHQ